MFSENYIFDPALVFLTKLIHLPFITPLAIRDMRVFNINSTEILGICMLLLSIFIFINLVRMRKQGAFNGKVYLINY